MKAHVVAGIGTGVGKTIVSAILAEALKCDYWKPIQAGNLDESDTDLVRGLVSNPHSVFHPEAYRFREAISPHAAAEAENRYIQTDKLKIPFTKNKLLVELAGGLMVPLNQATLNIDLLRLWRLPVILVSQNYLGSINHTLLSIQVLKSYDIPIAGLIFNGVTVRSSETFILQHSGLNCLARIPQLEILNKASIHKIAHTLASQLNTL